MTLLRAQRSRRRPDGGSSTAASSFPARAEERALSLLAYRHQRVQRLRRLLSNRGARSAERCFVVEGAKLLAEALDGGAHVESVYWDRTVAASADETIARRCMDLGLRVFELDAAVLGRIADTVNPQALLAVVSWLDVPLDEVLVSARANGSADVDAGLVVVCVDVRDPGNAGTVLRSAEAAGATAVVLCEGSVDLYNPKTVRASAGSLFHLPVVVGDSADEALARLGERGFRRWGTVAHGGSDYASVDLRGPTALVFGNEASGLDDGVLESLDASLTIPMVGRSESLNVGMAAAVLCFEVGRQRRSGIGL